MDQNVDQIKYQKGLKIEVKRPVYTFLASFGNELIIYRIGKAKKFNSITCQFIFVGKTIIVPNNDRKGTKIGHLRTKR